MIHYQLPSHLAKDISQFQEDITSFQGGAIHETAFKAKRVKMGVYGERGDQTHMIRIRCAGNVITPKQLVKVGELGERYGKPWAHVTTRAELQIHHISLENVMPIIEELEQVGLATKGGGGNTIRNIFTNADSGVHPSEEFDVQPHAIALTNRLIAEADSFELPRKFKTTFSSMADDAAYCTIQDLGFIAKTTDKGERGFQVYIGGGLGAKPKLGLLLDEFVPESKIFQVAKAIKTVFHEHGNRKAKNHSRIRFLIHEDMGFEPFKTLYFQEYYKILGDSAYDLDIIPIDNSENLNRNIEIAPLTGEIEGYQRWYENNATPQKQKGLYYFRLPLRLGDLSTEDCVRLEEILRPFGDNVLRCIDNQNLHVRNIPEAYLKQVYQGLKTMDTLSDKPVLYGNMIPCTGAQTCKLGINFPRPASAAIFKHLDEQAIEYDLLSDIRIHISGCPNSCANHWKGDLGFFGKVRREGGHPIPTYNVLGGANIKTGETRIAEHIGWVHSKDMPNFLEKVLAKYEQYKKVNDADTTFHNFWNDQGKEFITNLCIDEFNTIPSFDEDVSYYFDHGATEQFSTKGMGTAECSAGMYDMLDVDSKAIRVNIKIIDTWQENEEALKKTLQDTVFFSSRILLITRGEEATNDQEAYNLFLKHFIDKGLVGEEHRRIVEMAKDRAELLPDKDAVVNLGKAVVDLYKSMDNTMRFPGEKENFAINMETKKASST
ncbi:MAG: nitrite/sulfite reductase [SAR324 cluster bacterium]|nr:nitrite/sulfite reductase [SAR324 cluster bacterium]